MAKGCRDCRVCTEPFVMTLLLTWTGFRLVKWAMFDVWAGAVRRKCPQCGHYLTQHNRGAGGRFQD